MERKEAELLVNKLVTAKLLVNITNSVVDEVIVELLKNSTQGICQEVLDDLYVDGTYEKENKEGFDIFRDKIFEGVRDTFTINQLKLLEKSNQDSRNYHLMYAKLRDYFAQKVEESGVTDTTLFAYLDDYDTYRILFKEMANFTSEFGKGLLNKKNAMGKNAVDEDKIRDEFVR